MERHEILNSEIAGIYKMYAAFNFFLNAIFICTTTCLPDIQQTALVIWYLFDAVGQKVILGSTSQ
jgi:hypothetical protein